MQKMMDEYYEFPIWTMPRGCGASGFKLAELIADLETTTTMRGDC